LFDKYCRKPRLCGNSAGGAIRYALALWLACATQEEIADSLDIARQTITDGRGDLANVSPMTASGTVPLPMPPIFPHLSTMCSPDAQVPLGRPYDAVLSRPRTCLGPSRKHLRLALL